MTIEPTTSRRIVSLDQFRGYTVAGMLLVNFLSGYTFVPAILKHHNTYCSYADTIMPQFFFAVGFAYRLTFLRRMQSDGFVAASSAALRRNAGLILIGFVIYHLDGQVASWAELRGLSPSDLLARAFRRELFQALVHIALASIWVLPVIAAGVSVRVLFLLASAGLHLWLSSRFYLDWAWNTPVIDGGPLGFLSWTIPLLVGSMAYDAAISGHNPRRLAAMLGAWSIVVILAGYAISCAGGGWAPPPFVPPASSQRPDLWTMSQRTGQHLLPDILLGLFPGGLRTLRAGVRPRPVPQPHLPYLRGQCAGGLHHSSAGGRGRQALRTQGRPALVRRPRFQLLLRHLLRLEQVSRAAPALSEALMSGRSNGSGPIAP